jgi:hypothetical protein
MIMVDKKSGYAQNALLISYVSIWDSAFATDGAMRFYDKPLAEVVDVTVTWDVAGTPIVRIASYPHNPGDLVAMYTSREKEIIDLWSKARDFFRTKHRTTFTMDLRAGKFLTPDDFSGYSPIKSQDNMFIFDSEFSTGGFPCIYVFPSNQAYGDYQEVFPVQSYSSKMIAKLANTSTREGRIFVYRLLNSYRQGKWVPEVNSGIERVHFPTSSQETLPRYMNVEKLKERAESAGVEFIARVEPETTIKKDLGNESMLKIQKEVLDKGTVQLSDLFTVGLLEVIRSLPIKDTIVPINQDVSGGFEKACIFEGKLHIIPGAADPDFDYPSCMGESEEFFVIHQTEDTYPKRAVMSEVKAPELPLLPPVITDLKSDGKEYVQ